MWGQLHPESGQISASLGGRGNTEFASETAKASARSKSSINAHVARAEALGDDLDDVVGTSLDKGSYLDSIAKRDMTDAEQVQHVKDALEGLAGVRCLSGTCGAPARPQPGSSFNR